MSPNHTRVSFNRRVYCSTINQEAKRGKMNMNSTNYSMKTRPESQTDQTKPKPKDFNLPQTDEEMENVIKMMEACGMKRSEAKQNIKTCRTAYNRAIKEYDRLAKISITRKTTGRARKTSIETI